MITPSEDPEAANAETNLFLILDDLLTDMLQEAKAVGNVVQFSGPHLDRIFQRLSERSASITGGGNIAPGLIVASLRKSCAKNQSRIDSLGDPEYQEEEQREFDQAVGLIECLAWHLRIPSVGH